MHIDLDAILFTQWLDLLGTAVSQWKRMNSNQNCLCLMLCDTQRHTPYKISLTFVSDNLMFD